MKYKVNQNDSLLNLSRKIGVTCFSIVESNTRVQGLPKISEGQILNMPCVDESIVQILPYTYELFVQNIKRLKTNYPFIKVKTIGRSILGKKIYEISIGKGKNQVSYNASHHGAEWITTIMLMRFIEDFCRHFSKGEIFEDFCTEQIYMNSTIKLVPMVNPDGVNLSINGLRQENEKFHNQLIEYNKGNMDFTYWSANIRGVDLNHNYDALWDVSKEQEPEYGIFGPGPSKFSGIGPESEPESKALADYTRKHGFRLVIAFHSQGEVVYWDFAEKAPDESKQIVEKFCELSGYEAAGIAPGSASVGGYKDWFIDKFGKPGFTVEVGLGENPLPLQQFDEIYKKNVGILLTGAII